LQWTAALILGAAPMSSIPAVQWFARADRSLGSPPEALEVPVEVSGAHAVGSANTRELFTEATTTTLVSADGAVVRLSAAVVVGQLIFLRHSATQKEIVTRVLRQRSAGAASAYVELEFTETVPDFWGAELESTAVAEEKVVTGTVAAKMLGGEAAESSTPIANAGPDAEEVARLREELEGLRSQMSSLLESKTAPVASAPVEVASVASKMLTAAAPPAEAADSLAEELSEAAEESVTRIDQDPQFGSDASRSGGVKVRVGLIAALLIFGLVAASAYCESFLKNWYQQQIGSGTATGAIGSRASVPPRTGLAKAAAAVVSNVTSSAAAVKDRLAPTRGDAAPGNGATTGATIGDSASSRQENRADNADLRASDAAERKDVRNSESASLAEIAPAVMRTAEPSAEAAGAAAEEKFVPPSLIKAVNAVPPPDATRGFVTGDVKFDALVDESGKVVSAKVVSGPAPLRDAAMEALRQYQYKPASRNGQNVPARVPVTVKFWYEP